MSTKDKYFVVGGLIVCLVIAVMSPFIASPDPDGLEKSAENVGVGETEPAIQSPFPDYTINGLDKVGEIAALAIGIIVTLIIAYLVALLLRRRNPPETSP
ncbi:PDGLE domain-containing protein [uncultured Methanobacterium sp.]|uniref:PDGLE domain-containing protein n=1 Tax=uncultured Methanobacterium sp. TaxID=176306 RepID=UPI002AA84921|nr:PDGLE domain-containing protein [uncultured Methanobacterium sp.]